jgi:riboflavin synthase
VFTGIIEQIGYVRDLRSRGNYSVLTIEAAFHSGPPKVGESISCDGACLTVVSSEENSWVVEASQETAARTILSSYRIGSVINLERALRADGRLGGHFVTGHVDAVGEVLSARSVGESTEVTVTYDPGFDSLVVEKGSIAINGVSLTVNTVRKGSCSVNIIPFTMKETTSSQLRKGSRVNLEFDLIGKYILKNQKAPSAPRLTRRKLIESGW